MLQQPQYIDNEYYLIKYNTHQSYIFKADNHHNRGILVYVLKPSAVLDSAVLPIGSIITLPIIATHTVKFIQHLPNWEKAKELLSPEDFQKYIYPASPFITVSNFLYYEGLIYEFTSKTQVQLSNGAQESEFAFSAQDHFAYLTSRAPWNYLVPLTLFINRLRQVLKTQQDQSVCPECKNDSSYVYIGFTERGRCKSCHPEDYK